MLQPSCYKSNLIDRQTHRQKKSISHIIKATKLHLYLIKTKLLAAIKTLDLQYEPDLFGFKIFQVS